jgi:hypothetical protein
MSEEFASAQQLLQLTKTAGEDEKSEPVFERASIIVSATTLQPHRPSLEVLAELDVAVGAFADDAVVRKAGG